MSWFFATPPSFNNTNSELIVNRPINLSLISVFSKTLATPIGTSEQLAAISLSVDGTAADQYLFYPDASSRDADFVLLGLAIAEPSTTGAGWFYALVVTFNNSFGQPIKNLPINLDVVVTYEGTKHRPIGTKELLWAIRFDVTDRSSSKYLYYATEADRDTDLGNIQTAIAAIGGGGSGTCECFIQEIISSVTPIFDYGGDIDLENCNLKHYFLTADAPLVTMNGNPPEEDVLFKITIVGGKDGGVFDSAFSIPFTHAEGTEESIFAIAGGGTVTLAYNAALGIFFVTGDIYYNTYNRETTYAFAPTTDDLQTNTSNNTWMNQFDRNISFLRPGNYILTVTTGFNSDSTSSDIEIRSILDNDLVNPLGYGEGYSLKKEAKDSSDNWGGTGSNQRESTSFSHPFTINQWSSAHNIKIQFKPQNNGVEVSMWNTCISIVKAS